MPLTTSQENVLAKEKPHDQTDHEMIVDIRGDLLKSAPDDSLVGIPVNTVGVAGKGLARYMKVAWPEVYEHYKKDCRRGRIATGPLKVYRASRFYAALLPTKYYWGNPSDTSLIKVTCTRLLGHMKEHQIRECYIPRIGCGEKTGGLDYFVDVRPILEEVFGEEADILIKVYDWE